MGTQPDADAGDICKQDIQIDSICLVFVCLPANLPACLCGGWRLVRVDGFPFPVCLLACLVDPIRQSSTPGRIVVLDPVTHVICLAIQGGKRCSVCFLYPLPTHPCTDALPLDDAQQRFALFEAMYVLYLLARSLPAYAAKREAGLSTRSRRASVRTHACMHRRSVRPQTSRVLPFTPSSHLPLSTRGCIVIAALGHPRGHGEGWPTWGILLGAA